MHIRLATAADLPAINEIYNHYVRCSTCTYQLEPEPAEGRAAWFAAHGPNYPVTVAEADGDVVGWGSLSPFHPRGGYRFTVEDSVYVRHDRQGQGVGRAILADLIERARRAGFHTIIAGVSAEQLGSLALHERLGFQRVALLKAVGMKFDRWLDVVYLQLMLEAGSPTIGKEH